MKFIELKGIINEYVEVYLETESPISKSYDSVRFNGEPEKMFDVYGSARVKSIDIDCGTDGDKISCVVITREGDYE